MKTTLVHLEPHDDIVSVLDRLTWIKTPRALLLWPEEGCGLERRLDFVLLARRAQALGLRVALVGAPRAVRRLAESAGVPCFATREEALRRPWLRRRRTRRVRYLPPRRDLYALRSRLLDLAPRPLAPLLRLGVFSLGVLAVLALVAFTVPAAQVTLYPAYRTQEVTLTLQVSPDYTAPSLGRLPARWLEVTVSASMARPTTGTTWLPDRAAYAALRFTNLTEQEVTVPEGTRVRSRTAPRVVFATTEAVTVPPRGQRTVLARALDPGEEGNRPADDLQVLEGALAFALSVTNPQPATGGTRRQVPSPSPVDLSVLQVRLERALAEQAQAQLLAQADEDYLFPETLEHVATLEATYSARVGEPADTLSLTLRQRYRALLVERAIVEGIARQVLDARLEPGWEPVPDGLVLVPQGGLQPDPEVPTVYRWRVLARREVQPHLDADQVRAALVGRTPDAARAWLTAQWPQAAPPQVRLFPAWWPRLPWLAYRITVTVAPDGP